MKEQLSINTFFDFIISKENVQKQKPNPEVYFRILEYFHANPDECLVFEDSLHGIEAAKDANMETINVYDSYSDIDREKIEALTDFKITTYQEFLEYVIYKKKSKVKIYE